MATAAWAPSAATCDCGGADDGSSSDDSEGPCADSRGRALLGEREGPITRFGTLTTLALPLSAASGAKKRMLTVKSTDGKGKLGSPGWTGRVLWPSSASLATHLWEDDGMAAAAPRLRVLEVACGGAALPGLSLALRGHDVVLADLPEVLPMAARNVRRNARRWGVDLGGGGGGGGGGEGSQEGDGSGSVKYVGFDWEQEVPQDLHFDLIVGSDIVYAESHIPHIRRWLRTLLSRSSSSRGNSARPTEALISGENRSGTLGKLMAQLAADGIEVEPLPLPAAFVGARWEHPHPYSLLELYRLRQGAAAAAAAAPAVPAVPADDDAAANAAAADV